MAEWIPAHLLEAHNATVTRWTGPYPLGTTYVIANGSRSQCAYRSTASEAMALAERVILDPVLWLDGTIR